MSDVRTLSSETPDRTQARPVVSIVAPFFNEEPNVDLFFDRLLPVLEKTALPFEVVCINDGSRDGTLARLIARHAADPRIKILDLSRNFGKDTALTAGLNHARGDAVIPIDTDLQHPPELIPDLLAKWKEGHDVVYAARRSRGTESPVKRILARAFYRTFDRLSEVPIPPDAGDFRLLDRRVVDALNEMPERARFMKGLFAWVGFRQIGIPYDPESRHSGHSHFNFRRSWNFALDGLTAFSTLPLRIWGYFGFGLAALAFAFGLFLILRTLIQGVDVPGYASLMVTVLFLGGVQLMTLGIIGDYLGRVYNEVKRRPLYVVGRAYGIPERLPASVSDLSSPVS